MLPEILDPNLMDGEGESFWKGGFLAVPSLMEMDSDGRDRRVINFVRRFGNVSCLLIMIEGNFDVGFKQMNSFPLNILT